MPDIINNENSLFADAGDVYGRKIKSVPVPERNIGIDTDQEFYTALVDGIKTSMVDISKLDSFSNASRNRELLYQVIDTMSEDTTISAALEVYAEDATEISENSRIMWCQSDDENITKYITYLLDTLNVDKHIFSWAYCLCKYGDVYLRLYRESDFSDSLFNGSKEKQSLQENINTEQENIDNSNHTLDEDVIVKAYSKGDKFTHYVEIVPNPAEMFELTKFGKTYAYIQAPAGFGISKNSNDINGLNWRYSFRRSDVTLYNATSFVHGALIDNVSRFPETVDIFVDNNLENINEDNRLSYTVKKGQSVLYSVFKLWRNLTLLENSLLLNRLTKSSILRIIEVEVGDMPKENVGNYMMRLKALLEQQSALNTGDSMSEYTNPGPMENCVYVPTYKGIGSINTQQVGGDVDVKGLGDVDYFKNKLFSGLKIPKAFLGDTEDSAGFNGGASLSLLSSRYAKTVKRVQNVLIQMLTDAINILLLDKGLSSYINKFELKMQPPTTQEEVDRRDNMASKVAVTQDIMGLLDGIEDASIKLKALKILISDTVPGSEILQLLQDEIDRLESTAELETSMPTDDTDIDVDISGSGRHSAPPFETMGVSGEDETELNTPEAATEETTTTLPSPSELGIDMTSMEV